MRRRDEACGGSSRSRHVFVIGPCSPMDVLAWPAAANLPATLGESFLLRVNVEISDVLQCATMHALFRCFGSLYNIVTRASSHYQPPTQPLPAYAAERHSRRAKCHQCPTRTPGSRQCQLEEKEKSNRKKRDKRMDTIKTPSCASAHNLCCSFTVW